MNKLKFIFFCILIGALSIISCESILEDTDLNPIYFVECEIDGEKFRAQTNNNAWLSWTGTIEGEYTIYGQNVTEDKSIQITLFEQLGEDDINTGINVNSYFTNISYFHDNITFLAFPDGEGGKIKVETLTENEATGTFEAKLGEWKGGTQTVELTNGKFKVKTR